MKYFFKPQYGIVGDPIPYYFDGLFHIFYLLNHRDQDNHGIGSAWAHAVTADCVHFEDKGISLAKGDFNSQDMKIGTGSVITDDKGLHHIYYTGINPYFRKPGKKANGIMHAVSDDLYSWRKANEDILFPDESVYESHDWRDPFVYRDDRSGEYKMLLAARTREGPVFARGCIGLMVSRDLQCWRAAEPFYAPARYFCHECPDFFKLGDWYYLVYSEFSAKIGTRYALSRNPNGPWIEPENNFFDNGAFYAAKTVSDGKRRFIFGWNPTRERESDEGEWQWGGCLTTHELVQNRDGTLGVNMVPEAEQFFNRDVPHGLDTVDPATTGTITIESLYGQSLKLGDSTPDTYMISFQMKLDGPGRGGILLRMSERGNSGYQVVFDPRDKKLRFRKLHRDNWKPSYMLELDTRLHISEARWMEIRIVVDGTALVVYCGNRTAMSARMYDNMRGKLGLFADGVRAAFKNFRVATP
jgi:beta-fructofuranosidase